MVLIFYIMDCTPEQQQQQDAIARQRHLDEMLEARIGALYRRSQALIDRLAGLDAKVQEMTDESTKQHDTTSRKLDFLLTSAKRGDLFA